MMIGVQINLDMILWDCADKTTHTAIPDMTKPNCTMTHTTAWECLFCLYCSKDFLMGHAFIDNEALLWELHCVILVTPPKSWLKEDQRSLYSRLNSLLFLTRLWLLIQHFIINYRSFVLQFSFMRVEGDFWSISCHIARSNLFLPS